MASTRDSRFFKLKVKYCDLFLEAAKKEFPEGHNSGLSRAIQKRFGVSVSKATIARILAGKRGEYTNVKAICEYYEEFAELEIWQDACEDCGETSRSQDDSPSTADIDALVHYAQEKVRFSFESAVGVGDNDQTAWVKHHFVELDMVEVEKLPSEYPALNREVLRSSRESVEDEFDRIGIRLLRGRRTNGSEILEKYSRIFVYGDPGSGKTSYLQSIALRCRDRVCLERYVPVFVDIRHYSASAHAGTLRTHIDQMFEQWDLSIQDFEQLLSAGRILFLFDGLDEVPEAKRLSIQFMLQEILSIHSECRLICSSRLAAVFQLRGIQKVVISPFYSRKQIPLFVRRWFAFYDLDPSVAEAMLEKLYSSRYVEIREIARRPVLLKLLCITYEHNGDFPNRRADVFATGLNVLAKQIQHDNTTAASAPLRFTEIDIKNIVARVASYFFVHLGEQILFSVRDVERIIRTYYEEVHNVNPDAVDGSKIVKRIEHFNGLLVCWGGTYCSFSHLTYQEYFTAEYLVKTKNYAKVYNYLTDRRWSFVIELISELIPREQSWQFFVEFKNTIDEDVNGDTKLIYFLSRIEQAADFIARNHKGSKAFIQPLTRAWYFAYALENTGSITSFSNYRKGFTLPDLDFATSMVSDEILQGHEILYQAYHLCSRQDTYDRFENAILKMRKFFGNNSRIQEVIDGWKQLIEEQKIRFNSKHEWWDAKRGGWQKKIANLLDNQELPHIHNLNQEQLRRLRTYYRTSKLLSVCINCSTLPRDRLVEMVDSILRITHFIPDQDSEYLGLF
jgi:hypothetical protein